MSDACSPAEIEELKTLLERSTQGHWYVQPRDQYGFGPNVAINHSRDALRDYLVCTTVGAPDGRQEANAALIAAACTSLPRLLAEREALRTLLDQCRNDIGVAVCGEDGLECDDGLQTIERISALLGDKEDYDAQQKCADDPCERCGEDGIRHVNKIGHAKYEGLCDDCFASLSGKSNDEQ